MTQDGSTPSPGLQDRLSCAGCLAMMLSSVVLVVSGVIYIFFEALFYDCISWNIPAASQCLLDGSGGALALALVVIAVCVVALMLLAGFASLLGAGG